MRELYYRLSEAGFQPWLDERDLLPGQDWNLEIKKAVRSSDVVIVCLSKSAVNKTGFLQTEIKFALDIADQHPEGHIFVIPLRLDQCDVPFRLSTWQWANMFEQDGYEKLVKTLHAKALDLGMLEPSKPLTQVPIPQTSNPLLLTLAQGVTMELVCVPAGEFLMGSADSDKAAKVNEMPQHTVNLDEYLIGKYDVTNAQFRIFVQATGYKTTAEMVGVTYTYDGSNWVYRLGADWQHPWGLNSTLSGKDNHPVVCVSFYDAVAFSKWVTQVTGRKVALPTEAQWEKAARGTDGRIYPWGNQPPDSSRLNFGENVRNTTEVGKYSPAGDSPYGAADMAGNVWQFTADWFHEEYYATSPVNNPQGPALGQYRVLRGGSWGKDSCFSRSAYRSGDPPDYFTGRCGFRVVVAHVS